MSKILSAIIADADKRLQEVETKTIADIEKILDAAYLKLEKKLFDVYDRLPDNTAAIVRLNIMLQELGELINLVSPDNIDAYKLRYQELLATAQENGIDVAKLLSQATAGDKEQLLNVGVNFQAASQAAENASQRLYRYSDEFKQTATQIIGYNLAIGSSPRKTSRDLREAFGLTKGKSEQIARTESMAAYNESAERFYEQNEVEYVQVYATADSRVCGYCAARNQRIYKRGEIALPLHPYDRCFLSPVKSDWAAAGLLDVEFAKTFSDQVEAAAEVAPNYGVAPFEKYKQLKNPPKPIWRPGDDVSVISPLATPPKPEQKPETTKKTKTPKKTKNTEPDINFNVAPTVKELTKLGDKFLKTYFSDDTKEKIETEKKRFADIKAKFATSKEKANLAMQFVADEKEHYARLAAINAGRSQIMEGLRNKIIEVNNLTLDKAAEIVDGIYITKLPDGIKNKAKAIYTDILMLTGGKGKETVKRLILDDPRAYANRGEELINVGAGLDLRTQYHEFFHHVEFNSEAYRQAAEEWRDSRAFDKEPELLKTITGINYDDDEEAMRGNYYDPYVGKIYSDGATEVLSMGGERFATAEDMVKFLDADPGHFKFILGVILQRDK